MPGLKFAGPALLRLSGFAALNKIAITTIAKHALGRKIVPSWDISAELGVVFWRRQFTKAMTCGDIVRGRLILDAVQTETPDVYEVDHSFQNTPKGDWYTPRTRKTDAVVLYLHGGGYAFHGAMSKRFAQMLAHHIGAPVFAPDYRLTPEHSHPAQAEDALAAWRFMRTNHAPDKITIIGDSAGGHMVLSLLLDLKTHRHEQPALAIGLCPWTDIGARGASLTENDPYDLVQGWMAIEFGKWLDPGEKFGRTALSPISHDFSGLAPLYLQSGGREILHDMIVDFAKVQTAHGADVMLDVWPDMPHDFQLMDSTQSDALEALSRIAHAVHLRVDGGTLLEKSARTTDVSGRFAAQ